MALRLTRRHVGCVWSEIAPTTRLRSLLFVDALHFDLALVLVARWWFLPMRTVFATFDKDQVAIEMPVTIGAHVRLLPFTVAMCVMRMMGHFGVRSLGMLLMTVMVMTMVAVPFVSHRSMVVVPAVCWWCWRTLML